MVADESGVDSSYIETEHGTGDEWPHWIKLNSSEMNERHGLRFES
jgi:hypothetical protein